ncbi:MAG: hypothetical protein Q7R32_05400 [Dehalococcoidia bacterium]|nr:hypothetical protein [Dehalococcoidia bacterium]
MLRLGTFWRHKGLALAVLFTSVLLMLGACARGDVVSEESSPSQEHFSAGRLSYPTSTPAAGIDGLGYHDDIPLAPPPSLTEVLSSSEMAVLGQVTTVEAESYPVPYFFVSPDLICYEPPLRVDPKTGELITSGEGKPSPNDPSQPPQGAKVIVRGGAVLFWYKEAESPPHLWYRLEVHESVDVAHPGSASTAGSVSPGSVILVYGGMEGQSRPLAAGSDYLLFLAGQRAGPWEQHWSARFIAETRQSFQECDQDIIEAVEDFLRPFTAFLDEMAGPNFQPASSRFLVDPEGRLRADAEFSYSPPADGQGPSVFEELQGLTLKEAMGKIDATIQE